MVLDNPKVPFDKILTPNNIRSRLDALERKEEPSNEVGALDEITERTGNLVVDNIVAISDEVEVTEPTDPAFTGSGMSGKGKTFTNITGMIFNIFSVATGLLQVGFNTLGQLVWGAGAVLADKLGLRFIGGDSETIDNTKSVAWVDTIGNYISRIFSYVYTLGAVVIGGTTISVEPPNANISNFLVEVIDNLAKKVAFMITCGTGAAITINWYGVDVDTVIKGDTTDVLTVDAGLEAVGIGGAAESGFPLKVTGNTKVTGTITSGTSLVALGTHVGTGAIADDGVYSFTPPATTGILMAMRAGTTGANTTEFIYGFFDTANSYLHYTSIGTQTEQTTGALTGTTGTDGKFTVSVHTNGKLYFENRRGAGRSWRVSVFNA